MDGPTPPAVAVAVNDLRARGLRVSAARRRILEALFRAEGPLTAEAIAGGANVASVYRNLDVLERAGVVRHLRLGRGPALFAAGRCEYTWCERCGELRALASEELDGVRRAAAEALGFSARFSRFPLIGLCATCNLQPGRNEF